VKRRAFVEDVLWVSFPLPNPKFVNQQARNIDLQKSRKHRKQPTIATNHMLESQQKTFCG
jgi:hypothetical protein